jgi:hypothetical protein
MSSHFGKLIERVDNKSQEEGQSVYVYIREVESVAALLVYERKLEQATFSSYSATRHDCVRAEISCVFISRWRCMHVPFFWHFREFDNNNHLLCFLGHFSVRVHKRCHFHAGCKEG